MIKVVERISSTYAIRQWLKERVQGLDEFDIDELTAEAVEEFLARPEYVQTVLTEHLRPIIDRFVRDAIKTLKNHANGGDAIVPTAAGGILADKLARKRAKFLEYPERVGPMKMRVIGAMTKADVQAAAAHRWGYVKKHEPKARFYDALAEAIASETATVQEMFTEKQLAQLWKEVNGDVSF